MLKATLAVKKDVKLKKYLNGIVFLKRKLWDKNKKV